MMEKLRVRSLSEALRIAFIADQTVAEIPVIAAGNLT
jgi:hypothetical protein